MILSDGRPWEINLDGPNWGAKGKRGKKKLFFTPSRSGGKEGHLEMGGLKQKKRFYERQEREKGISYLGVRGRHGATPKFEKKSGDL